MSDPLAGVAERLYRDYPAVPLAELIELIRQCREDVDTSAAQDGSPELVEVRARARLRARADGGGAE